MTKTDVLILGAGPAGCAAALALRAAGYEALLVDKSTMQGNRVGELVPPGAQTFVLEHDLWKHVEPSVLLRLEALVSWQDDKLRGTEDVECLWWAIDRAAFDRGILAGAVEAGATAWLESGLADFDRQDDGWRVRVQSPDGGRELTARWLIDATGRPSTLARKLGARRTAHDQQIALVGFMHGPPGEAPAYMIVEAQRDGWWYAAPLEPGRVVMVYLTDADLTEGDPEKAWRTGLGGSRILKELMVHYTLHGEPLRVSANSSLLWPIHGPGWTAVGDARAGFDPISTGGLTFAVSSGHQGGTAVAAALEGQTEGLEEYARQTREAFEGYLPDRREQYLLVDRWPESPFWERRRRPLQVLV